MDVSNDISVFDNYGASTFTYLHEGTAYTIKGIRCGIEEKDGDNSFGIYRRYYTYFRFSLADMIVVPSVGDIIDGEWTILQIDVRQWNGGYGIKAVNLNLYGYLQNTISIYTPVFSTDAWAERINTPTATITNLACRIQPIENLEVDLAGKRGTQRVYKIYTNFTGDISYGSTIIDEHGKQYLFKGLISRENLDSFDIIEAVRNE